MIIENEFPPYFEWLLAAGLAPGALWIWLLTNVALLVAGLLGSFIFLTVRHGPTKSGDLIFKALAGVTDDVVHTSPRRVYALARLAVQEALRRRVLVGFMLFILILLFAGWFLDPGRTDPAKLYLSFVINATSYLVLFVALVLSAFSLPADLQSKTIYTVVTKPVRPSEVVLGRTLGFAAVGTGLLLVMGLFSYIFVVRTLDHTHTLTADDLAPKAPTEKGLVPPNKTGTTARHRHVVNPDQIALLAQEGHAETEPEQGHYHEITAFSRDGETEYRLGPPLGQLRARVPVYGTLMFRDRGGKPAEKGINVGNEWTYHSYIEGGSPAAGIWKFTGVTPDGFPNGIVLELSIRVFRTFKGTIDQPVLGSITLRNPTKPNEPITLKNFRAAEYAIDRHEIPAQFKDAKGREIDLFRDVVSDDGKMEVEIQCLERSQFYGLARPSVYLLRREGTPWVNFAKGYVAIWLQMLLVTAFGVMWSTFLNGPVAMLATLGSIVGGFFVSFLQNLALNKSLGGGTFESMLRISQQKNLTEQLETDVTSAVAVMLDKIFRIPLFVVSRILPNFQELNDVNYVADGYNISGDLLAIHLTTGLGYFIPVMLLGFLFFKLREVAK